MPHQVAQEGETGWREPAPARSGCSEWRGRRRLSQCHSCTLPHPHSTLPQVFSSLGQPLRTLAPKVRGMGSLAFSGLNSLLGSPLCCVGDDETEWGRGGEPSGVFRLLGSQNMRLEWVFH